MEVSALTQAHAHARNASQETAKSRLSIAANEHELAAGDFAKAAQSTADVEALRILKLLEEQHQKLAQIIKATDVASKRAAESIASSSYSNTNTTPASDQGTSATAPHVATLPYKPSAPSVRKMAERKESSPALAKDIASRRGIPSSSQRRGLSIAPNISTLQAVGKISTGAPKNSAKEVQLGSGAEQDTLALKSSQLPHRGVGEKALGQDEGFSRFYSNLASGPLSKLSSMLAFAGLPLIEDDKDDAAKPIQTGDRTNSRATTGPDVKKIFSKAALRAIEEQQRSQGFSGSTFGPGESFYVIPASGGTASYANILSRAQQDAQRQHLGDGSDEFVDARESQATQTAMIGRGTDGTDLPLGSVREEELQIENAALKQILDKLSHRLQAFESHAQDASMAALTQSMASVRTQGTGPSSDAEERMRAMEAQLEMEMKERERLGVENQKQKQLIAKYRSHWEQLKDSARARDKAKRDKADSAD